jgi:hypothetical protein
VISPKAAQKARKEKLKPLLGDLEKSIDEYLSTSEPTESGEYWYNITGLSFEVSLGLVHLYSDMWDVRINYDQRDGDSLVLKAKK